VLSTLSPYLNNQYVTATQILTSTLTEPLCRSKDASAFLNGVGVLGVMTDFRNTGVSDSDLTWLSLTHSLSYSHTHTRLTALFPGLPGWAGTRKVRTIWILPNWQTTSGNGISWAICKSAPHSRQTTMPVPHNSVCYRPDALPATQPTASKHWRSETAINLHHSSS